MKIHLRIILAGIVVFSLFSYAAHAAPEIETECNLGKDAAVLAEAESFAGSEQERLVKELSARKILLAHVLSCAIEETRGVAQDLAFVKILEHEIRIARFKATLIGSLTATENYYASQQEKIKDLGLWGSKVMARDVREWRLKNFALTKEAVASFILWRNHQELLVAAHTRLAQIHDTVRILELEKNEEVALLVKSAEASLAYAKERYAVLDAAFSSQAIPEKPLEIVKASLEALGDTYQSFFDLSETVKTLLPRSRGQ